VHVTFNNKSWIDTKRAFVILDTGLGKLRIDIERDMAQGVLSLYTDIVPWSLEKFAGQGT
jgi:hypothetical protein